MSESQRTRREFLRSAGLVAAGTALSARNYAARGAGASGRHRNILFFMCDQHRPDALGHYGDPFALTPNLDALAAGGTSFRRTYCQNPVCVPSRNSILTGRYCHSTGVWNNGFRSRRDLTTFAEVLRRKEYKTGCFGKLHVKGRDDLDWDAYNPAKNKKHGGGEEGGGSGQLPTSFQGGKYSLGAPSPGGPRDTREYQAKEGAIQFMKKHRDEPWLIQCSMYKPHPPFQPPKNYWEKIDRSKLAVPRYPADDLSDCAPRLPAKMRDRKLNKLTDEQVLDGMQGYYGNLAFADAMIGEVLDALDRLGLRERTLVVYTADHGEMLDDHGLWTKYTFFEQSVRVPLIMSCPGLVPAGRETKALVEHVDLFPTFMDVLHLPTPSSVQGQSFLPLLTGKAEKHRDVARSEHYVHPEGGGKDLIPIRMQFDGRYKFIDNGPDVPPELYDLQADPREITNLAPRPEHAERVKQVLAELRQWGLKDAVEPADRAGKGGGKADRPRRGPNKSRKTR